MRDAARNCSPSPGGEHPPAGRHPRAAPSPDGPPRWRRVGSSMREWRTALHRPRLRAAARSRPVASRVDRCRHSPASRVCAGAATSPSTGSARRPRYDPECLDDGARPQRPAAARLHDTGRALASARRGRGRRPALSRDAHGLRGQALLRPRRRRSCARCARAAVQLVEHRRIVSGGSTLTMQVARLIEGQHERTGSGKLRQIVARAAARAPPRQAANPVAVPAPRAVRRQHRGRARGLARLLRQGAATACRWARRRCSSRCRSRPSGAAPTATREQRAARAIACCSGQPRKASSRPRRRNARPMSPCRSARRAFPKLAPHLAEAEVAANPDAAHSSADHRPQRAEGARRRSPRSRPSCSARSFPPPSSPSTTRPAR